MSAQQRIWIPVGLAVVVLAGVGYWFLSADRLAKASEEDLVTQLQKADTATAYRITLELGNRGEVALPLIVDTYNKMAGNTQVQMLLADSVAQMQPTQATVDALANMAKQMPDAEMKKRIQGLEINLRGVAERRARRGAK